MVDVTVMQISGTPVMCAHAHATPKLRQEVLPDRTRHSTATLRGKIMRLAQGLINTSSSMCQCLSRATCAPQVGGSGGYSVLGMRKGARHEKRSIEDLASDLLLYRHTVQQYSDALSAVPTLPETHRYLLLGGPFSHGSGVRCGLSPCNFDRRVDTTNHQAGQVSSRPVPSSVLSATLTCHLSTGRSSISIDETAKQLCCNGCVRYLSITIVAIPWTGVVEDAHCRNALSINSSTSTCSRRRSSASGSQQSACKGVARTPVSVSVSDCSCMSLTLQDTAASAPGPPAMSSPGPSPQQTTTLQGGWVIVVGALLTLCILGVHLSPLRVYHSQSTGISVSGKAPSSHASLVWHIRSRCALLEVWLQSSADCVQGVVHQGLLLQRGEGSLCMPPTIISASQI